MASSARRNEIRLVLLDCDGVLTDGRLYLSERGEELKVFDVQDGQGIVEWIRTGNFVAIVSGRESTIVAKRAEELGIQVVRQRVIDKVATVKEICDDLGIKLDEAAFVGDDIPDIRAMKAVGFGVAVANAVDEVKAVADHVTSKSGGRGAVREVTDLLLAAKRT